VLKKWKEGVRSKFSANDLHENKAVSPKIGPDPDFFNTPGRWCGSAESTRLAVARDEARVRMPAHARGASRVINGSDFDDFS